MVAFWYPKDGPEGSLDLSVLLPNVVIFKNNLNFLVSTINLALLSGYCGWATKHGSENRLRDENVV